MKCCVVNEASEARDEKMQAIYGSIYEDLLEHNKMADYPYQSNVPS